MSRHHEPSRRSESSQHRHRLPWPTRHLDPNAPVVEFSRRDVVTDVDFHLAAQNRFHFDIDGWRTLKFFFYLTPTDLRTGAHQYIRASHRRRKLQHQFTAFTGRPTPQLESFYTADDFLTIAGGAGFGFLAEDPFVFHTGTVCRDRPRLMLEIGLRRLSSESRLQEAGFHLRKARLTGPANHILFQTCRGCDSEPSRGRYAPTPASGSITEPAPLPARRLGLEILQGRAAVTPPKTSGAAA